MILCSIQMDTSSEQAMQQCNFGNYKANNFGQVLSIVAFIIFLELSDLFFYSCFFYLLVFISLPST